MVDLSIDLIQEKSKKKVWKKFFSNFNLVKIDFKVIIKIESVVLVKNC